MTARDERIALEFLQIKKSFREYDNILITRKNKGLKQSIFVTYLIKGYNKIGDESPIISERHKVEIKFPLTYPNKSPVIKFETPLWHPMVKDNILCLPKNYFETNTIAQLISYIADIIQCKALCSENTANPGATMWYKEHSNLVPTDDFSFKVLSADNDTFSFEIKTSPKIKLDLLLCKFRLSKPALFYKKSGFSLRIIFTKTLLWTFIGLLFAIFVTSVASPLTSNRFIAWQQDYHSLAEYFKYSDYASDAFSQPNGSYKEFCKKNSIDYRDSGSFITWYVYDATKIDSASVDDYKLYNEIASNALVKSFEEEFESNYNKLETTIHSITIMAEAIPLVIFSCLLTFFINFGEGVYYGSKQKAIISGLISSLVATVLSIGSSVVTEWIYIVFINEDSSNATAMLIRAFSLMLIGMIVGLCSSIRKKNRKRIAYFIAFGAFGGFIAGLFYNYIKRTVYDSTVEIALILLILGISIGIMLGIAEQLSKQSWLREIKNGKLRKEYIIHGRKIRLGKRIYNDVVLKNSNRVANKHVTVFSDRGKYVLIDLKSKFGTILNGESVRYALLKPGDIIDIGDKKFMFGAKQK